MIDIILTGCNGKMGDAVTACISEKRDIRIAAGIDINTSVSRSYPVFASFDELGDIKADAVIDFSNPAVFAPMIEWCRKNSVPAVICTTGLSDEQKDSIKETAKAIPVFYSANMSLGVNILIELAKTAAKILGNDFDIEIVEQHHNRKIDAPSGTALMIADAIKGELEGDTRYEYDRHSKRERRSKNEIGIHAVRGGTIVGEHEVIFAGNDEILKISHSARSKALFAAGAVNAAKFIAGKAPGLYDMSDFINDG